MPLKVISMVKVDGRWVEQEDMPEEKFQEILEQVMIRAANAIGVRAEKMSAKTAEKSDKTMEGREQV
ncbi:MAG: hypothetical protein Q4C77_01595 [Eubacteriales bacterium]|nr:hypothetical protein [Eubacteriales bacterium]